LYPELTRVLVSHLYHSDLGLRYSTALAAPADCLPVCFPDNARQVIHVLLRGRLATVVEDCLAHCGAIFSQRIRERSHARIFCCGFNDCFTGV
jgi:hypothetical protein